MKILNWNIKGGSSLGWIAGKRIESQLVDEIIKENADVIVLTEFVVIKGVDYLLEKLNEKGFAYFTSNCSGKNGILIAVKKIIFDHHKFVEKIYTEELISSRTEDCNILKVELPLRDRGNLVILGCRMETGYYNDLTTQYNFERKCFDKHLIPTIRPLKEENKYIIAGDFNNAQCRGNLNLAYNVKDYINIKDNCLYAQHNYNLNIIKDEFERIGLIMIDKTSAGKAIMTHKKVYRGNEYWYPDDHIFVNGFCLIKECKSIPTAESDHNILIAEVE